jgi:hypothetical protein
MEQEHFIVNEKYVLIPLNKIIIDKSIIDAVKSRGGRIPKIKYSNEFTAPLNRMDSMLIAFKNKIPLPAVKLIPVENTGYYVIQNGRHRVAASILFNYSYIPGKIIQIA